MESLSSSHGVDSCWCRMDHELAPMNTAQYTTLRLRIKTSDYADTCGAEYSDEKKHSRRGSRVRKVMNSYISSREV